MSSTAVTSVISQSGFNMSHMDLNNTFNYTHDGGHSHPDPVELPIYFFAYMTVINIIVFIVGVFGNTLVIIVVCQVRAMRNSTNYFLFTLSIADLCVLLVCQPVAIMEFYAKERWYIGEAMCKILHCHIYLFDIYIIYHSIYSFSNKTI